MKKVILVALFFILQPHAICAEVEILSIKDAFRDPYVLRIQLSPDAKHILTTLNEKNQKTLTLLNVEKDSAIDLYKIEGQEITDIKWIDNDTVFLEFYLVKSRTSAMALLDIPSEIRLKPEVRMIQTEGYLVSPLAEIDDQLLFAKKKGEGYELYRISPADLVAGKFDGSLALTKKIDGKARYFYDEHNDQYMAYSFEAGRSQCLVLDKYSNTWIRIWESDSPADTFIPIGFIDQSTLAVLSNIETERTALRTYDVGQRKFIDTLYEHPRYDLISAGFEAKSRKPHFVTYREHGQVATHYFSTGDANLENALKNTFNNKQIRVVSETKSGDRKLIYVTASNDPGEFYFFDLKMLTARPIYPRFNHLEKYQLAKTEKYEIEHDGEKIETILTPPIGVGNDVLLVMPHGGPIGVRDTDDFNLMNQYFASRGYTVLNVNFRGSTGYGKKFAEAGRGEFGQAIENDINAAVDAILKKRPFKHLCAIGASYGGYSAAMLAIQNPQRYQCAVSMFGVFDLPLLFSSSNLAILPNQQKAIRYVVGENTPALKTISPVYLAEKLKVPVLLVAGKLDPIATFEQSSRFKQQLKRFNKSVETLFFDNVGHGHHEWRSEQVQFAYIDAFLRETLKLAPIPNKIVNAEEALLIADAFYFDDNVANDLGTALKYYRKATDMDDPRGMYILGLMYQQGDGVAKNQSLAIEWYKKAAARDFLAANDRLGHMFLNPKEGVVNTEQSFAYFKKAAELKSKTAALEMAKAYALGIGVPKDWDKAEELFLKPLTNEDEKKIQKKILAEIAWDSSLNELDTSKLKNILRALYDNPIFTTKLTDDEHGIYRTSKTYRSPGGYVDEDRREEKTTSISIKNGVRFGALLEFSKTNQNAKRVALKYYWRRPASVDIDNRIYKNGAFIDVFESDTDVPFVYQLDTASELVAGDWQLEVRTLDNELLYIKNFSTVQPNSRPTELTEKK